MPLAAAARAQAGHELKRVLMQGGMDISRVGGGDANKANLTDGTDTLTAKSNRGRAVKVNGVTPTRSTAPAPFL